MTTGKDFFDNRAETWEEICYPESVRQRLAILIPEFGVTFGSSVLDIGAGPGILLPYLRKKVGAEGRVFAFDLSLQMVRQAIKKPLSAQDMFVQADVHHIPCRSVAFEHVICFAAFPHFSDPLQALREMSRVVRPEGSVVIAHLLSRKELAEHHASHSEVCRDLLPGDSQMAQLFQQAGLSLPQIVDLPGRYLAKARKRP